MAEKGFYGVPILPIHDSFIVNTNWAGFDDESEGDLDRVMRTAFKEEIGVDCKIKFDIRELSTQREQEKRKKNKGKTPTLMTYEEIRKEERKSATYNRHYKDWYSGLDVYETRSRMLKENEKKQRRKGSRRRRRSK